MAWPTGNSAITLLSADGTTTVGNPHGTSTATVNLFEQDGGPTADTLCMFGLKASDIVSQSGGNNYIDSATVPPGLDGDTDVSEWQGASDQGPETCRLLYVENGHDAGGKVAFRFKDDGALPFKLTVIPTRKRNQSWYCTTVWYGDSPPDAAITEDYSAADGSYPLYNLRNQLGAAEIRRQQYCVISIC